MSRALFSSLPPVLVVILVCGHGCGSSGNGGARPEPDIVLGSPIVEGEFASTFAVMLCGAVEGCCQAGMFGFDRAKCETQTEQTLAKQMANVLQDGGRIYNPQNAGNCAATYKSLASRCIAGLSLDSANEACKYVFEGTLAQGEPCTSSRRCVPGLGCHPDSSGVERCLAVQPLPEGGDCALAGLDSTLPCQEGLFCDYQTTRKCVPLPGNGETCLGECNSESLYCDHAPGETWTCKPTASLGQNCVGAFSPSCGPGLQCDLGSGVCAPRERPITGEMCSQFRFEHF